MSPDPAPPMARAIALLAAGDGLGEQVDHGLLEHGDERSHLDPAPSEVDEGIEHDLARAVISDLAAPLDLHDRNSAVAARSVPRICGEPERVDRRMLEQPELVGSVANNSPATTQFW